MGINGWPSKIAIVDENEKVVFTRGQPEWRMGEVTAVRYQAETGVTLLVTT